MLYDLEAIPLQISDTVQKGTYRDWSLRET
jgi:hypothetical protein